MILLKPYCQTFDSIPEVSTGFGKKTTRDYYFVGKEKNLYTEALPVKNFSALVEPEKTYAIKVEIKATEDVPLLYLFSSKRHLEAICSLRKGETYRETIYTSLTETIPFESDSCFKHDRLFVSYCTKFPEHIQIRCTAETTQLPRFFLCGDSTVADQVAAIPYIAPLSHSSWGQSLSLFLANAIAIDNQATSGNTTESFRLQGHFDIVKRYIRPNEFCLLQFGHNDQKMPHLLPHREYGKNIINYLNELKQLGAQPILVTPLGRNLWDTHGNYLDLLIEYADMLKKIGKQFGVPVIDLHQHSVNLWKTFGSLRSTDYFPKEDYTHTNEFGSYLMAEKIAEALAELFPTIFTKRKVQTFNPPNNLWSSYLKNTNRFEGNSSSSSLHQMENKVESLVNTILQVKSKDTIHRKDAK